MKIPFSWLQSFIPKKLDPHVVAQKLTSLGLEVERIDKPKPFGQFFVVGKVVTSEKHPNADRLHVCTLQTSKKGTRTVVCGAPNVRAGQTVVVALPGAVVAGDKKINETEIRGVTSSGMICAEDELGLGSDHEGILVLDATLEPGTLLDAANLRESILDVEVTPNRPDWLSVYGVAREVALAERTKLLDVEMAVKDSAPLFSSTRSIAVAKLAAIQYHLRGASFISTKKTPQWMRARLAVYGSATDNFIVDVTNYVLYELGQPLHAFDADKVKGKKISVRFAKPKETITLLDGKTCTLKKDDIVITDARGPIALAGVMGGKDTAVTETTKNVIIESAIFPSMNIRRTSRRLGVRTDAANRFEKGITPDLPKRAVNRALYLLQAQGEVKIMRGMISFVQVQKKQKPLVVSLRSMNRLLGAHISLSDAKNILTRLSCVCSLRGSDQLTVTPPIFRTDILQDADVAEELARVVGYSKLGQTLPSIHMSAGSIDDIILLQKHMRDASIRFGYTELLQPSFYGKGKLVWATLPEHEHRTVANPLDAEQQYLRADVLPGMIAVAEHSRKAHANVKVFELGQVFWKNMKPGTHEWRIGWVVSFQDGGEFIEIQEDIAEIFSLVLGVAKRDIHIGAGTNLRDIKIGTTPVGLLTLRPLKKGMTSACIECSLSELLLHKVKRMYHPPSKFPSTFRDVSVIVPISMDTFTLRRQLFQASMFVHDVKLFDAHPQSDTTVSFAFHLEFASDDRTLSSQEVDTEMTSIARALQQKGGIVRT